MATSFRHPRPQWLGACLAAWIAGCAGPRARPAESRPAAEATVDAEQHGDAAAWSSGLTDAEVRALDPRVFAGRFHRPIFCAQAARALNRASRDKAWATLAACVDKGNFTLLDLLADAPWREELPWRPEAAAIIARVVAARGGDAVADAARLESLGAPFAPLEAALGQGGQTAGRLVLLRAEVAASDVEEGWPVLRLTAKGKDGPVPVLGRLREADPHLEPGRELVLVGRLEGRVALGGAGAHGVEAIAVLNVMSYAEPAAAVVE